MAIHAVRIMSADDYRRLRAADALVADLRLPLNYLEGHIEGAVSLPGTRYHLRYQLAEMGGDRALVLIAQAAVDIDPFILEAHAAGVAVTGILTGAPRGWQARGLPVLAWQPLSPETLAGAEPLPEVISLGEMSETVDPTWPDVRRIPLSTWTRDTVDELAGHPVVLVGPAERVRHVAVRLFEAGARHVYYGQTARSTTASARTG